MQLKFTVLAAALSASVAADFVVFTIPTPNIDIFNIQSQLSSIKSGASSRIADLTKSLPASEISLAVSANSALRNFIATASISVPAQVTELGKYEQFTSGAPSWYSALPSDLKAYYDANNAKVQSAINEAVGVTGGSSATLPSRTGTAAAAGKTGAASAEKVKAYMGVGAAAAFGVFVL